MGHFFIQVGVALHIAIRQHLYSLSLYFTNIFFTSSYNLYFSIIIDTTCHESAYLLFLEEQIMEVQAMYVITGATGRTGSAVTNYLLDHRQPIRVIGRNLERLMPFVLKGAEPIVSEPTNVKRLIKAFSEAEAVYVMLQPN